MHRLLLLATALWLVPAPVVAQPHTVVALSHTDFTAYEIDPTSGKVVKTFKAAEQPHEGIASPDGRTYYVAVPNGPHVVVLDGQTFAQKALVTSPFFTSSRPNKSASPHGIAVTDDGARVYVGLENADIPGIVVIDTATNRVLKKIDVVLKGGHFLAIQPKTSKLYYPMREDHRVLVLDTKTDAITKIIPIEGGPVGVGFAPNGEVWIHNDNDGTAHIIDSSTDTVVHTMKDLGKGAGRMAVSADGRFAASTHSGSEDVTLIDAKARAVLARIPLGRGPAFPMFSPDGAKLYVMSYGVGDLAVIDTATRAIVARHKAGATPFGGSLRITGGTRSQ
jgi:YVTN family beta-propeller protein